MDIKSLVTQAIFEILEKSQLLHNCTMVDIKIGFGVNVTTKKIALAGVIDIDSCRRWPWGDSSQQKDSPTMTLNK